MKKSYIAGLLSVIGGGLGILSIFFSGIWLLFGGFGPMFQSGGWGSNAPDWLGPLVGAVVGIVILVTLAGAIVAIIGGLSAMRQKSWALGLAGAIAAVFASSALGIAAIVLIALGRNEFPTQSAPPPPTGTT